MNNKAFTCLVLFFSLFSLAPIHAKANLALHKLNETTMQLTLSFDADDGHGIYQDSLELSVNNPHIQLSEWKASIEPITRYDATFKTSKKLFIDPFTITFTASSAAPFDPAASLFVTYYRQGAPKIVQDIFELSPREQTPQIEPQSSDPEIVTIIVEEAPATPEAESAKAVSWSAYIQNIIQKTESTAARLVLALFLGLLLSLTPCIYPMIPITMGILQSQGSTSMIRNFFLALTYTLGIATTFALLGLSAALTGKMFGSFMSNPIVIVGIVAVMVYLAGSMIGWYDMYIPSFMKPKNTQLQGGSLLSIFLFGAVSGTIASPCLSPGLLLLLTLVTTLNNYAMGFALLFAFGFGLGIPLLIIGTFSSSLNILPRAGMWMVEVKQFFGFIMLGTCLYFLQIIIPGYLVAWLGAGLAFSVGAIYLGQSAREKRGSRIYKTILGGFLVALSVYISFHALKVTMQQAYAIEKSVWLTDYEQAVQLAKKDGKKLLLDISAPYCSICKAIDKKIFADHKVIAALASSYIAVKIDDIEANETTLQLKEKFNVVGAPTILVYDPETDTELLRWGSELYDSSVEEFLKQIEA